MRIARFFLFDLFKQRLDRSVSVFSRQHLRLNLSRHHRRRDAAALLRQLLARLQMRIEVGKRLDDDRHGQVDDDHADDRRHRAAEHAEQRAGHDVAEAERARRADRQPDAVDDRDELIVGRAAEPFGVVHQRAGDHHGEKEEEEQEAQHTRRVGHGGDDHFQTRMEIAQLEHAHDADGRQEIESGVVAVEAVVVVQDVGEAEPEGAEEV